MKLKKNIYKTTKIFTNRFDRHPRLLKKVFIYDYYIYLKTKKNVNRKVVIFA